jgi:large subunit ribosomal protein L17
MRHGKKFNHLKRKAAHRKALLRNMSAALIEHKRIKTTLAKAKALRQYIEPLVTKAKDDSMHNRRVVFSYLHDKEAVKELFGPVAAKVGDRPGGYVRIIRLGFRRSDGAEMAMIEFVDFNETYEAGRKSGKGGGKKKRTRRGGKGSSTEAAETLTAVAGAEVAQEVAAEAESGNEDEEE